MNLNSLSKKELYEFMQAVRPFCKLNQSEISRETNMSVGAVSQVFQGISSNQEIIDCIMSNLKDGWEAAIPESLKVAAA